MWRRSVVLLFAVGGSGFGCGRQPEPAAAPTSTASACPADTLAPGEVQVFATGFDVDGVAGTEGLAFGPTGRLFVGGSGVGGGGYVAEVFPDGTWTHLVDVPGSVGLAWWKDRLMVATTLTADGTPGVVAVDPDAATADPFVDGMDGANFLAVTPWDTLLVSSPGGEDLWEVRVDAAGGAPEVTTWATGVPSPNGIAFGLDGSLVYVANTYVNPSVVSAIAVSADGEPGPVGVLTTLPDGSTQDGVALGAGGELYVLNNVPGTIARVRPDGTWEIAASGVAWAASIAFGEGEGFDPCSAYVSSLFSADVYRVGLGAPGAAIRR